jgi:UDP-N-acetylmuramoylalanine--D-glutamate ligase
MSETMRAPRLSAHDPDLHDLRVLVVGCGRSGLAAAQLALSRGAQVTLTDIRTEEALGQAAAEVLRRGATLHAGGNPQQLAEGADLVVLSPGVPPEIPLLKRARALALPVWGEIELASRFQRGRVVAVTGSNGKSTVTTMIGAILSRTAVPVEVGGNLDRPFAEFVDPTSTETIYVLELSSFQLETLESLHADVALLLNLSPDHLDRYPDMASYAEAKARLLRLQEPDAAAVLNADDPASRQFDSSVRGRLHLFSTEGPVERGAFVRDGRIILLTEQGEDQVIEVSALPLPGRHNLANALAASLAARLAGCDVATIAAGLLDYRPLPHRLERVRTLRGVALYNDSKATNPDSAACALASFEQGRVRLILGGKDKGADWDGLVSLIGRHARQVLLVGDASEALAARLEGVVPYTACGTIARAVETAFGDAVAGDVILLSPGCASFDQYRNFEARGEDFKQAVARLADREGADDA